MSIILSENDKNELSINAWNWGVVHHLINKAGILPDEVWEPKRYNGGGDLTHEQVATVVKYLKSEVLPRLKAGERMFPDGKTTRTPDDGTMYRGDDAWKNYSLNHEVLTKLIAFLEGTNGSVTFC